MPPPSTPSGGGGSQPGPGSNVGGGGVPGTTGGVGGGASGPQGTGTQGPGQTRTPQEMMQDLEDQFDLFETTVTSIRAELRETKQNLRNAIRRNETDALVIQGLNNDIVSLTTRLQAATGSLDGTRLVSALGRLRYGTDTLGIERDMLRVLNLEARTVNPVDVL